MVVTFLPLAHVDENVPVLDRAAAKVIAYSIQKMAPCQKRWRWPSENAEALKGSYRVRGCCGRPKSSSCGYCSLGIR